MCDCGAVWCFVPRMWQGVRVLSAVEWWYGRWEEFQMVCMRPISCMLAAGALVGLIWTCGGCPATRRPAVCSVLGQYVWALVACGRGFFCSGCGRVGSQIGNFLAGGAAALGAWYHWLLHWLKTVNMHWCLV